MVVILVFVFFKLFVLWLVLLNGDNVLNIVLVIGMYDLEVIMILMKEGSRSVLKYWINNWDLYELLK